MRTTRLLLTLLAVAAFVVVGTSTSVGAQDYPPPTPPPSEVLPETLTPGGRTPEVIGASATPAQAVTGGLPVTGGDAVSLAILGLGAIAVGTVLVRRRPSES